MGRLARRPLAGRAVPAGIGLLMCMYLGAACESAPGPQQESPAGGTSPPQIPLDTFSAERAWGDLQALAQRGTPGASADPASALRSYVTEQLAATRLAVELLETPDPSGTTDATTWSHVVATAPGASSDLFVLVAPLGDRIASAGARDAEESVSAAALLLEIARVLSTRSLPYTTRFVWLAGEQTAASHAPDSAVDLRGSRALAASMAARGDLSRVRLLVAFDRICGADLRIARDLASHRVYREEFFDAASRAGRESVFPRTQDFESPQASHLAFRSAGLHAVVALVASGSAATGSGASPDQGARAQCEAAGLDAVGSVSLDALDAIGRRLAKIDRFSRAPLTTLQEGAPGGEARSDSP